MSEPLRTRDDVVSMLTALFRGRGAFAPSPGEVDRQVNFRRRFLPGDPDAWSALVLRARCRATGERMAEHYRGRGWSKDRFEALWQRGADAVLAGLAEEGRSSMQLAAVADASKRLVALGRLQPSAT